MNERDDTATAAAEDWLDRALREDGLDHRAGYLADDGFTARVAAALPAPATLPAWRKPVVALLWMVAAGGLALALPGTVAGVIDEAVRLLGRHPISLVDVATGVAALGLAGWAAAGYALRVTR